MSTEYLACRDCTLALVNDDMSQLEEGSPRYDDVRRGVEAAPLLSFVGPADSDDTNPIQACDVCQQTMYEEQWNIFTATEKED